MVPGRRILGYQQAWEGCYSNLLLYPHSSKVRYAFVLLCQQASEVHCSYLLLYQQSLWEVRDMHQRIVSIRNEQLRIGEREQRIEMTELNAKIEDR